jgi:thiaminase
VKYDSLTQMEQLSVPCKAAVASCGGDTLQRRRQATGPGHDTETKSAEPQEWGVDLEQLNARPNATTAAYTKFLLRLAEGPQASHSF